MKSGNTQNGKKLVIAPNGGLSHPYRFFGIILVLAAAFLILTLKTEGALVGIPILAIGAVCIVNSPLTLIFDKTTGKFTYRQPYPVYETSDEFILFKKKSGVRDLASIKAIKHLNLDVYFFSRTYGAKTSRMHLVFLLKGGEQVSFLGVYESEAVKIAKFLGLPLMRASFLERGRLEEGLKYLKPPANSPESQVDGRFDEPSSGKIIVKRRNA